MKDYAKGVMSIIAPCYNGENYISRFLESILSQTYTKIQLIVVNDGSTDKTEEILKEYEEKFAESGMEFVHFFQKNQGIGGAINNALKYVTGEYLSWFGTDDYALPIYAEKMAAFLQENPDYAVVRCDGFLVDENDTTNIKGLFALNNNDKHNPNLFENAILEKGFHFGYSVLRMDVFDQCNPSREIYPSRQGQNWQLLLPVFYEHKAAFIDEPLYCVVDNSSSVSRNPHKSYKKTQEQNLEYEKILTKVLNSMNIPDREKYMRIVTEKYIRRRMLAAINFEQYEDAVVEYDLLKQHGTATWKDFERILRVKYPVINKVAKLLKKSK